MTITKRHEYTDDIGNIINIAGTAKEGAVAHVEIEDDYDTKSFSVTEKASVPLALNVLGHDRSDDDPLAVRFEANGSRTLIAASQGERDSQLNYAAALLMAVDGYDRRVVRLATAAERRERAAESLSNDVASIEARRITSKSLGSDEIGKLREALGRYDAALAN